MDKSEQCLLLNVLCAAVGLIVTWIMGGWYGVLFAIPQMGFLILQIYYLPKNYHGLRQTVKEEKE